MDSAIPFRVRINFDGKYADINRALRSYESHARGSGTIGSLAEQKPEEFLTTLKEGEAVSQLSSLPSPPHSVTHAVLQEPESLVRAQPNFEAFPMPEERKEVAPQILSTRRVTADEVEKISKQPLSERIEHVRQLVAEAGEKHGIDPALSLAVVSAESSFNPRAVSSDGFASKGLFQLLDSTGKTLLERADKPTGNYNPFDPSTNVDLGVGYLRYLHEVFSKSTPLSKDLSSIPAASSSQVEKLAVAAFNAGEGRVAYAQAQAKTRGKDPTQFDQVKPYLPEITQQYVDKVISERDEFGATLSTIKVPD